MFPTPPPETGRDVSRAILDRFRKAAVSPQGLFEYPTGRTGLAALGYAADFVDSLSEAVAECFCGVGNPFAPGLPQPGEAVLDVGCGAGVDAILAARIVGPEGRVAGLEFSLDMLRRAKENALLDGAANLSLHPGGAEALPFAAESFDLLVSNGVYNLVPDKPRALAEALRVLKPGGRFQLADQILESEAPPVCPLPVPGQAAGSDWAR